MKKILTIITPVYNRCELTKRLYESLINQKNQNFVWLVVNDGSKENISDFMKEVIDSSKIPVKYYEKENGGKHTALNVAFANIDTELAVIIDNDDYMPEDATKIIEEKWGKWSKENVAGIVFSKTYNNGNMIGHSELEEGIYDMFFARFRNKISGDKAEVFRSNILCKYRFLEFSGEKYGTEAQIWEQIYAKYKMAICNIPICICEYLVDGLSSQGRKLRVLSPRGMEAYSMLGMRSPYPVKEIIKRTWLYIAYATILKRNVGQIIGKSPNKPVTVMMYIPGMMLGCYWRKKYVRE